MSEQPSGKHRSHWTPLLFFVLLVLGVFIGFQLHRYIGNKRPITTVVERNDRLEEIINLISDRYVDTVSADSLYQDAIAGILNHLDPHTSYIPAAKVAAQEALLRGHYKGIGIKIFNIDDTLMISRVFPNSPAEQAGLRVGDGLFAVGHDTIMGRPVTLAQVHKMIAHSTDDSVSLTVLRRQTGKVQTLKLQRGSVMMPSVPSYFMLDKNTGYIKVSDFSATTFKEFNKALKVLKQQQMTQLILDLRNNPGGYVDAATGVANEFLANKHLIVYTKGSASPRHDYLATKDGLFKKGRLVVIINAGTASAAEILTGALQDWDRAVIIGARSFGKGLVQQSFQMGDGSLLRLTIAKYYTPSGRCIQRSYRDGRLAYQQAYLNRLFYPDSNFADDGHYRNESDTTTYFSKRHHRPLKAGGGILPDSVIRPDLPFSEENMLKVTSGAAFNKAVFRYYIRHYTQFNRQKSPEQFVQSVKIPEDLLDQIRNETAKTFPRAAFVLWQNPLALDYLRKQIKSQLVQLLFSTNSYYYFKAQSDEDVETARKIIDSKAYLKLIGGESV